MTEPKLPPLPECDFYTLSRDEIKAIQREAFNAGWVYGKAEHAQAAEVAARKPTHDWIEEARVIAAQCWYDPTTTHVEMDVALAEVVAKRIALWMEDAARYANNEAYWHERALKAEAALAAQPPAQDAQPVAADWQSAVEWIEEAVDYVNYEGMSPSLEREGRDLLVRLLAHPPAASQDAQDALRKLAAFGAKVLEEHRDELADVDGFTLQNFAEKCGVLVPVRMTESCGEGCRCDPTDGPFDCYRVPDAVRVAIDAAMKGDAK